MLHTATAGLFPHTSHTYPFPTLHPNRGSTTTPILPPAPPHHHPLTACYVNALRSIASYVSFLVVLSRLTFTFSPDLDGTRCAFCTSGGAGTWDRMDGRAGERACSLDARARARFLINARALYISGRPFSSASFRLSHYHLVSLFSNARCRTWRARMARGGRQIFASPHLFHAFWTRFYLYAAQTY